MLRPHRQMLQSVGELSYPKPNSSQGSPTVLSKTPHNQVIDHCIIFHLVSSYSDTFRSEAQDSTCARQVERHYQS